MRFTFTISAQFTQHIPVDENRWQHWPALVDKTEKHGHAEGMGEALGSCAD
jgi:hypothetical protein